MSRALKLFCVIGPLFILIALISFLWPSIVIRQDLSKVETIFTSETTKEQVTAAKTRASLFQLKIDQTLNLIHSSLIYVQESKSLQNAFENAFDKGAAWKKAGQTLSYNTGIGLLQITQNDKPLLAIAPQNAQLYATKISPLNGHVVFAIIDDYRGLLEPYIGIRLLQDDPLSKDPFGFYFLYPTSYFLPGISVKSSDFPASLRTFATKISRDLENQKIRALTDLIPYLAQNYSRATVDAALEGVQEKPSAKDLLSFYNHENAFFTALSIRQFIRTLLEGIDKSPFENGAPYGIAALSVEPTTAFNGLSMLSEDIFFENTLTNGVQESSYLLIDNPLLKEIFIGAMADVQVDSSTFNVTIGSSISPLISDLVSNLEALAIISENGKPYVAINPEGLSLPHEVVAQMSLQAAAQAPYGVITFNNIRYQFMKLEPFAKSDLAIIILRPEDSDPITSLHRTVSNQLHATSDSLAWQLLSINVFILIIALIILLVLSRAITKPVRQLAVATEELAKGNYEQIHFPAIPQNKQDEISILNEGFKSMVASLRDKEKMRAVLDKVVSKEIAAEILKGDIHLGGENRIVTVMFADIRDFTPMSERLEPERLISFLNKFMTKMSVIIEEHYGVIDKYVGDEIMALYGAPHLDPEGARKAVETALLMIAELKKWNIERMSEGFPEISIGIGINTGKMIAGNMGAENRLNYTVLGANVNLSARLCAKALPMQILVSEQTLEACGLKDKLQYEEIESLSLKGISTPVKAFSILGFKENL